MNLSTIFFQRTGGEEAERMNKLYDIQFSNGYLIDTETMSKVVEAIFAALKQELPEEAQCYEIIKYVLSEAEKELERMKVNL